MSIVTASYPAVAQPLQLNKNIPDKLNEIENYEWHPVSLCILSLGRIGLRNCLQSKLQCSLMVL